jgi:hypothetical protein
VTRAHRAFFVIAAGVWLAAHPAVGAAQDSVSNAPPSVAPMPVAPLAFARRAFAPLPATPLALAPLPVAPMPFAPLHALPLAARPDSACEGCPRKRWGMAVLMGLATNVFINRFDTWVLNVKDPPPDGYYTRVTTRSWGVNIRKGWVWDTDAFPVNMFMHPIQGGTYFRAGRSNGLDFWESVPLAFLGSAEWEFFGETTFPSLNDFYNTGFGGIVVGETFYRLAAVIRNNQARGMARFLRELAAVPLDPSGSVKRLFSGEAWRSHANPGEHEPPPLALQLQAGVRLATDSLSSGHRSVAGALVAELEYGDAFDTPYTRPFDVFLLRGLISPSNTSPVGEARVAGRLYAHELTYTSAPIRTIFTVRQKIEYTENPAYKFGGQSVEAGLVTSFDLGNGVDVRTESFVEAIMLGAVDAAKFTTDTTTGVRTGIAGSARTYDFGPGAGFDVRASLRVNRFTVLSARWHGTLVHSVSGSPADHHTQLPSVEVALPVTRTLGLGAYAGWYARRSSYFGNLGETKTYPDYRAYLVWQTHPRSAAPEAP